MNEYDILLEIFRFIRNYSTSVYTLPQVFREVVRYMKDGGYNVEIVDDKHRDYKILQVEGNSYKIIRWPDWVSFEVQRTA